MAADFPNSPTENQKYRISAARTNFVTNPNLETNATGWTAASTPAVRSTDYAFLGSSSFKVTMSSSTDNNIMVNTPDFVGTGNATFSVYAYVPAGSTLAGLSVTLSVEAGTATSSAVSSTPAVLVAGSWVRMSITRNVTVAGTMTIVGRLSVLPSTRAGQNIYFDAALAEFSSSALPYFDGTFAKGETYQQSWTGTANASTSTSRYYLSPRFNYTSTFSRTNLVRNPNFENDISDWFISASGSGARITTDSYVGTSSCQVTLTNPTNGDGITKYNPEGIRIAVSPNTTYTISAYFKQTSGSAIGLDIDHFFYNAAGQTISSGDGPNETLTGSWQRISKTITTTALTTSMSFGFGVQQNYTGTFVFLVDAVLMEAASSALPYFDGTYADVYTGYSLVSKSWTGGSNASTSTALYSQNKWSVVGGDADVGANNIFRTNLITNPGFETNTTGWNANGSTNTRVSSTWSTGNWVYQIVHTSTGLGGAFSDFGSFNVTAGLVYTASFDAKSVSGTLRGLQIAIVWYNSSGAQISTSTADKVLSLNSQRWSVTGTAPVGAVTGLVYAYTYTTGVIGDTWQMDSVLVEQIGAALPYFDGTYSAEYSGYRLTTQAWNGTANASTSTARYSSSRFGGEPISSANILAKGNLIAGSDSLNVTNRSVGTNGQLLTVDLSTASGLNYTNAPASSATSLGAITNVTLTSLTENEGLTWNGTAWVNSSYPFFGDYVINRKSAAYTLQLTDKNKLLEISSDVTVQVTVPTNTVAAFPIGSQIHLIQLGTGQVTVGGAGVTFNGRTKLRAQYSMATLIKRATDTWVLSGDIAD